MVASMGVVHRQTFESQLEGHLAGSAGDLELAWHTLRYTILATGSRIHLSQTPSFHQANQIAWRYFENALALHTQTLLFKASLTSVQALTVMVSEQLILESG